MRGTSVLGSGCWSHSRTYCKPGGSSSSTVAWPARTTTRCIISTVLAAADFSAVHGGYDGLAWRGVCVVGGGETLECAVHRRSANTAHCCTAVRVEIFNHDLLFAGHGLGMVCSSAQTVGLAQQRQRCEQQWDGQQHACASCIH